jgi:predicted nucleic acid-binding Zn ribbon protein
VEKIGEILSRMLSKRTYRKRIQQGPVFERWDEVVGEFLAQKCTPTAVYNRVLVVEVEDSVWMQELHMHKGQILQKIASLVGPGIIDDIRWTIGPGTTGGAKEPIKRGESHVKSPQHRPLTEKEDRWVQSMTDQLKDPDLRRSLEKALRSFLSSGREG